MTPPMRLSSSNSNIGVGHKKVFCNLCGSHISLEECAYSTISHDPRFASTPLIDPCVSWIFFSLDDLHVIVASFILAPLKYEGFCRGVPNAWTSVGLLGQFLRRVRRTLRLKITHRRSRAKKTELTEALGEFIRKNKKEYRAKKASPEAGRESLNDRDKRQNKKD